MTMIEPRIEVHLLARCRQAGFLCWKFTSPGHAGVPDRIVITPVATVFVEVKRPGSRLRRQQEAVVGRMRRAGAVVDVVDTIAAVDELVEHLAKTKEAT